MTSIVKSLLGLSEISITVTLILVAATIVYLRGWHRLSYNSRCKVSSWKRNAFVTGVLLLWIAAGSGIAMLDHELLTMHMVQHLLLMTIAPPFLLFGQPILCFEHGLPEFLSRRANRLLQHRSMQSLVKFLINPAFCFLTATKVLIAWHIPVVFDLAMHSQFWHAIETASFLAAGILFWLPVIEPWTAVGEPLQWWIPLYLFLGTLPCDALSAFLAFCDRVIYPSYANENRHGFVLHISALQDQQYAGALMWLCVTFAYLLPAVIFMAALLSSTATNLRKPDRMSHRLPILE
jgi:putative membrane protein